MNINLFSQVLKIVAKDQDIDNIRLLKGELLEGKHTLLHTIDEAAIYAFLDLTKYIDSITDWIQTQYTDVNLRWMENLNNEWNVVEFKSKDIQNALQGKRAGFLFFPVLSQNTSLIAFRELIAHLRAPDGCPWDREQTHQSLKTNLLEETYEVLDAIDGKVPAELQEELGDLLLQIILHAQIASEAGDFDIADVIQGIHQKLTFRHPHVFDNLEVNGVDHILHNWEILKSQERENNHTTKESILDSIPRNLPALTLAQKYQERAARVGFDWPEIEPVLDKVIEEIDEFRRASDKSEQEAELGDLLFALVNVIRWNEMDAEGILRKMTKRFYVRFKKIEQEAASQGRKLSSLSLEEMDKYWELAKDDEQSAG